VRYRTGDYSWRDQEAPINSYPQFMVTVDDIPAHFIHVRGALADSRRAPPPTSSAGAGATNLRRWQVQPRRALPHGRGA